MNMQFDSRLVNRFLVLRENHIEEWTIRIDFHGQEIVVAVDLSQLCGEPAENGLLLLDSVRRQNYVTSDLSFTVQRSLLQAGLMATHIT
jgi:hypothetical protein